jgi:hypothetical protein
MIVMNGRQTSELAADLAVCQQKKPETMQGFAASK